ncbi:MAG: hypothetical protein JJ895_02405 [Balneolaceae bacterium]|nr:hypothetical protein [Balneolaceae bacterium]
MHNILKKVLIVLAVAVIYFFGIRELRKSIHEIYRGTLLPNDYGIVNEDLSFYAQSSVSFTFCNDCEEYGKGWQFKIPFGSFFLFSVIGLVLIGVDHIPYIVLSGFHFMMGILTLILVCLAINYTSSLLIIVDFISRYLLPLGSFGYVAFVYGKSKMKDSPHADQS